MNPELFPIGKGARTRAGLHSVRAVRLALIPLVLLTALAAACRNEDGAKPETGDVSHAAAESPAPYAEKRDSPVEYSASHILIMHRDVPGAPATVQRTRAEADDLARRILVLIRTDRAWFEDLARKYSDDPQTRERGGFLGTFRDGELIPTFELLLTELEVGHIGGPVETEYGFHVVRREPLRRVRAQHILVAWRGARKTGKVERTKDDALALALQVRDQVRRSPESFCNAALRLSDDPHNRTQCGELGWVEPGELSSEIDEVLFRLRPGEISDVVESPYGYHVFRRNPESSAP